MFHLCQMLLSAYSSHLALPLQACIYKITISKLVNMCSFYLCGIMYAALCCFEVWPTVTLKILKSDQNVYLRCIN
jgi:hypothetical protein